MKAASKILRTLLCFACLLASPRPGSGAETGSDITPFHFGFSSAFLANVSPNDAKAAVKVWAQTLVREQNIPADPEADVVTSAETIAARLRARSLDGVAMTTSEYRRLDQPAQLFDFFVAVQSGRTNVEYLVLVHRESAITNLSGLRGKQLLCHENPRSSLAVPWLDSLLQQQGLPPSPEFFTRTTRQRKVTAAILPVFFRQSDACLVDRLGFDTMCELNPQVGKQLRPLAVSPLLVPMLLCLRADYSPTIKPRILEALSRLHTSPAGQQLLTIFQFDRVQRADPDCLRSGLELLEHHETICATKPIAPATAKEAQPN